MTERAWQIIWSMLAAIMVLMLIGWMSISYRIVRADARLTALEARLRIKPEDVLCTLAARLEVLHRGVVAHCGQVHDLTLPPWEPIPTCMGYIWQDDAGEERKEQ